MAEIKLDKTETKLSVSGVIRFGNVLNLRREGNRLIRLVNASDIKVDLAGVDSSDTSGLSLLLCWIRYAKQHNKKIQYQSIPMQLLKVAKTCGIVQLLSE